MSPGSIRAPVGPAKSLQTSAQVPATKGIEEGTASAAASYHSPTVRPVTKDETLPQACDQGALSAAGGLHAALTDETQPIADTPKGLLKMSQLSLSERSVSSSSESDSRRSAPASFSTPKIVPKLDWTPRTPYTATTCTDQATPSTAATLPPATPKSLWSSQSPIGSASSFVPWFSRSIKEDTPSEVKGRYIHSADLHVDAFAGGHNTAEEVGRYLMICDIPKEVTPQQIREMAQSIAEIKAVVYKHLRTKGCVIVLFYDPRQALKLYNRLRSTTVRFWEGGSLVALHCVKIEKEVVQQTTSDEGEWQEIWATSESVLLVRITGQSGISHVGMQGVLSRLGDVQRLQPIGHAGKIFVVEYWDTRDASHAITSLNQLSHSAFAISATYYDAQTAQSLSRKTPPLLTQVGPTLGSSAYRPDSFNRDFDRSVSVPTHPQRVLPQVDDLFSGPHPAARRQLQPNSRWPASEMHLCTSAESPMSTNPTRSDGYEGGIRSPFGTPTRLTAMSRRLGEPAALQGILNQVDSSARTVRGQSISGHWDPIDRQAIPERNRVFPERIASGLDGRTTVMIKDVPNKLSRQELVDILSEVTPGDFDFVYLRFDFKNCCNVGYAFVNFTTVNALYKFIRAKVGKKWNLFSSEKVLQVSYANIQGKAALINKFRNSAVMDVIEAWRPQIFYSSGSLKGHPEPFPQSDSLGIRERSTQARLSALSQSYPVEDTFESGDRYDYSSRPFDGYSF